MKIRLKNRLTKLFICFFAISLLAMMPQGYWNLGSLRLLTNTSNQVLQAGSVGAAYGTDFLTSVGGVDFQLVASPQDGFEVKKLKLRYNKGKNDGYRLEVRINGKKYLVNAADWMLVPIAHYAESDYTALVTTFGRAANINGFVKGIEEGETAESLLFHPAVKNELLGIRLMQADLMLKDASDYYALATYSDQVILGEGESELTDSLKLVMKQNGGKVEETMVALETKEAAVANTWILTDQGMSVKFYPLNRNLYFTGQPYYQFYSKAKGRYQKLKLLDQGIAEQNGTIEKMNPYVMNAVKTTSQLSAFFRYVKINYPSVWSEFMADIGKSGHISSVNTPSDYYRTYEYD